jgi:DNA topoisomerase IB
MRLRRSSVETPGITRRRRGKGFSYEHASGNPVRDKETLERIRALVIPPAWEEVWICANPVGHIQAAGTDAAGRRQYLYHADWRVRRDAEKFDRMLAFAQALPRLRERVALDLSLRGMPKDKALACAVRLLDQGFFRVGSESYARQNGSFGLATLRKEHVKVQKDQIVFDFKAKSGVRRVQTVHDPTVAPLVRTMKLRRSGGRELLAYRQGPRWRDVRSSDINEYVRDAAGAEFTTKDFRTWHGTVLAAVFLATGDKDANSATSRKRIVSASIREVAGYLGNTPAVARASYVDPRVVDRFEEGVTIATTLDRLPADEPTDAIFREGVEAAVLDLLQEDPAPATRAA